MSKRTAVRTNRAEWVIGVCRESEDAPWQFYLDGGEMAAGVFDADKDGLIDAMYWCGEDGAALAELWKTWNYALRLNA